MSWQQLLNDRSLTITTGDGTEYKPNWLNANKETQYNSKVYDFPELEGSFVPRKKKRGDRFRLELYFTGENATANAEAFEISARDPRPWTLVHPFYDTRLIQPIALTVDDSDYNTSKVTVQAVETISFQQISFEAIPIDSIIAIKSSFDVSLENSYILGVAQPTANDVIDLEESINVFDKIFEPIFIQSETLSDFKVLVGTATSNASELINNATRAIRTANNLINYPAIVAQSLKSRIDAFNEAFQNFTNTVTANSDLGSITPAEKNLYLVNGANIISNIAFASIIQPDIGEDGVYSLKGEYFTRKDILNQIDLILFLYNQLIDILDSLTTDRSDNEDSFFANDELMFQLDQLIVLTVSNLENSIFNAVQERTLILDKDSDIINVSHRLFGSETADENIDKLIETNNLSLNDMLELKKGKEILYYT